MGDEDKPCEQGCCPAWPLIGICGEANILRDVEATWLTVFSPFLECSKNRIREHFLLVS